MNQKQDVAFFWFLLLLDLAISETISVGNMYDAVGEPGVADWVIAVVIGGPVVALAFFIPLLILGGLIATVVFWRR
jgi:hypothetical protein